VQEGSNVESLSTEISLMSGFFCRIEEEIWADFLLHGR
jgi:hypothetical protein